MGNTMCAGNQCCPGGVTCPSASPDFTGYAAGKTEDCTGSEPAPSPTPPPATTSSPTTPSPTSAGTCSIGEDVRCPNSNTMCAGNQCCPGGVTCPSASPDFTGCPSGKTNDCTGSDPVPTPVPSPPSASPTPAGTCSVGDSVQCPN